MVSWPRVSLYRLNEDLSQRNSPGLILPAHFKLGLVGLHHQPVTLLKILAHQGIHPIPPHT